MPYLYETHCHTNISSACSTMSPEDIVDLYLKNGYTGIFITDHFLNGNCTPRCRDNALTYAEKIDAFMEGYRAVKKAAEGKLDVFFGLESSYHGSDFLLYGWGEEELKKFDYESLGMHMRGFIRTARESGALTVQAHPFREAPFIDHIRLFLEVEGVETFNGCRTNFENRMAQIYAREYGKLCIGGSDIHSVNQPLLSGIRTERRIEGVEDFISIVREGKYQIIEKENEILR